MIQMKEKRKFNYVTLALLGAVVALVVLIYFNIV
jgi:hypothetical protein